MRSARAAGLELAGWMVLIGVVGAGCGSSSEPAAAAAKRDASSATESGGPAGPQAAPADSGAADSPAQDAPPADSAGLDVAAEGAATPAGDGAAGTFWSPSSAQPVHFHWQLSTTFVYPRDVVQSANPVVYDLDGENTDAATVAQLHALGARVICYVDVGTWEKFRSDAASFPASVLGKSNGWPGEKWLDVRQQSILLPLMKARFQSWCVAKGFDAIEPDNLDGWQNKSGFPLTQQENLSYDRAIAALGHSLGLSVGLKNLPGNAPALEPHFEWALDEQCFQFHECSGLETSFIAKGKAVFEVEYHQAPDCASAIAAHMNSQQRDLNLVGPAATGYAYTPCLADSATAW